MLMLCYQTNSDDRYTRGRVCYSAARSIHAGVRSDAGGIPCARRLTFVTRGTRMLQYGVAEPCGRVKRRGAQSQKQYTRYAYGFCTATSLKLGEWVGIAPRRFTRAPGLIAPYS